MMLVKKSHSKPRFNSLFDEFFHGDFPSAFNKEFSRNPSVNVIETNDSYKIQVAAPGFSRENLKVDIDESLLTISGEYKTETKEEGEKFTRKEFGFSSFSRSFNIPDTVNAENINGTYKDGILTIELPKLEEVKGISKTIEIS